MSAAASWIDSAQQLSRLLKSGGGNGGRILQLIGSLNSSVYPIEHLKSEVFIHLTKPADYYQVWYDIGCGKFSPLFCGMQ